MALKPRPPSHTAMGGRKKTRGEREREREKERERMRKKERERERKKERERGRGRERKNDRTRERERGRERPPRQSPGVGLHEAPRRSPRTRTLWALMAMSQSPASQQLILLLLPAEQGQSGRLGV